MWFTDERGNKVNTESNRPGISSNQFHDKSSDVVDSGLESNFHNKEHEGKVTEDQVWEYINSLEKPMSESAILSKWGSRGDPERSHAADLIDKMIDSGRLEFYSDDIGTSKHKIHRRPVISSYDEPPRMYYETMEELERRNEDLKQLALKHGKEYNIDPEKVIMTSGSNYNSPDSATPPYLEYSIYVYSATPEQRSKLIKKLDEMGLEVKDEGKTYINFKDKYIEPTNYNFHHLGFNQKNWNDLVGVGIWDKKGRKLGDGNFGSR